LGGVAAEARQVQHLLESLKAAGSLVDRIDKYLVFLTGIADFWVMNEVNSAFLGSHRAAPSTIAVAELALDAKFEIECVALVG